MQSPISGNLSVGEKEVSSKSTTLWKQKFKCEDLRVVMMLFEPSDWMFSFHLKSG